jgi:DNA-binding transcriptional ArsR family regulator
MPKTVHILTLGSKERVLKSLRKSSHPVNKVYLVLESKKANSTADQIEKELKTLIEVEKIQVDSSDVYSAVLSLANAVREELNEGNEVVLNLTGNSVKLAIVYFIVAQLSGSKLYISDSEIPVPKLRKIGNEKLEVLWKLRDEGGEVFSVSKLIDLLEGISDNEQEYMAQRAKIGYRIKNLEELGLVETQKIGRNVNIRLTKLGEAYVCLAGFLARVDHFENE